MIITTTTKSCDLLLNAKIETIQSKV